MSAQENPTGIESTYNIAAQGAQEIAKNIEGAQVVRNNPRIPKALHEAGGEQADLGNVSGEPDPDALRAVSVSDSKSQDPTTGGGWGKALFARASRKVA